MLRIKGVHIRDDLPYFHSVCPNILYRCRPDLTRYEREILDATIPSINAVFGEVVPVFSGANVQMDIFSVFADRDPFDAHGDDGFFWVSGEKKIRAASEQ